MAKVGINTGSAPNAGDGSTLLAGANAVNSNFNEVYNLIGDGTNLLAGFVTSIVAGNNVTVSGATGAVTINASGGGGGGGGMGIPAGNGGTSPEGSAHYGTAGSATAAGDGGEGAEVTSRGEATINGGKGGEGGFQGNTEDGIPDAGQSGFLSGGEHEDAETYSGGAGGANGGAIRKASGSISFTLVGSPTIIGTTNETGVS